MNIRIRVLSLAFAATVAVTAMTASQAQAGSFDINTDPAALTGHTSLVLFQLTKTNGSGGGIAVCVTASFEGTVQQGGGEAQSTKEATITPTFGNSEATPTGCSLGGGEGHILMNGCKFTLTGSEQAANTYLLDITGCTAGKNMQIKGPSCTIDVPEQNGLSHVVSANAEGNAVQLTMKLTKITNTQTGASCSDGNNHQAPSLSFSSSTTVKAFIDRGAQQVTSHEHQYSGSILQSMGFAVGTQPAVLTGNNESNQQHTITVQSTQGSERRYHCASSFEGTTQGLQVQELTVTAAYAECKFATTNVQVAMNGCKYTITNESHPVSTSTVDIVGCTAGKQITIQDIACQTVVPEQNGLSHVVSANPGGSPHAVTLAWTVGNITNTQHGFGCPDFNNHHGTGLSFTGNMLVKAYEDQGGVQVEQTGHQHTRPKEGKQVGLTSPSIAQVNLTST